MKHTLPEDTLHGDVHLALDEPHDALELVARQTESAHQELPRRSKDGLARTGEAPRGGGAVDAVDRGDLIDPEAVRVVLAQDVSLLRVERARGLLEGFLHLRAVLALQVLKLRIVVGSAHRERALIFFGERELALLGAGHVEQRARRDDAHESLERAEAGVVGDLAGGALLAHEELRPDGLREVVERRLATAGSQPDGFEGRPVRTLEGREGFWVADGARPREEEVRAAQLVGAPLHDAGRVLEERLRVDSRGPPVRLAGLARVR